VEKANCCNVLVKKYSLELKPGLQSLSAEKKKDGLDRKVVSGDMDRIASYNLTRISCKCKLQLPYFCYLAII
jgi:hypothetical protein